MSANEAVRFSGLILAGGQGVRWGGPKAWARLPDGRSFIGACATTLTAAGASPVMATLPPGADPDPLRGVETVVLPEAELDMFASLQCGLERLLAEPGWQAVVLLPVDHPLVAPSTVERLVAAGPPAAIPTLAGRHGHPVCMWRPLAQRVVGDLRRSSNLRDVLREVEATDVAVTDRGVRANCNTPEALLAAISEAEQERGTHDQ